MCGVASDYYEKPKAILKLWNCLTFDAERLTFAFVRTHRPVKTNNEFHYKHIFTKNNHDVVIQIWKTNSTKWM
jgi:hypothetical protein